MGNLSKLKGNKPKKSKKQPSVVQSSAVSNTNQQLVYKSAEEAPTTEGEFSEDDSNSTAWPHNNTNHSSANSSTPNNTFGTSTQTAYKQNYDARYIGGVYTGTGSMVNGVQAKGQAPDKGADFSNTLWEGNIIPSGVSADMVNGAQYHYSDDGNHWEPSDYRVKGDFINNRHGGDGDMINGMQILREK